MADVKNRVSLHFVWGTYDRLPKLTPEVMEVAEQCIRAVGDEFHCTVIAIGGTVDHVHILVHFATTISIGDFAQEMKGYSTRVINERFPDLYFKWQGSYGVFPVTPNLKPRVIAYIKNQEKHHHDKTTITTLEDTFTPKKTPQTQTISAVRAGGLESQ
jgi:putative transposase